MSNPKGVIFPCCSNSKKADTGRHSKGHHNHERHARPRNGRLTDAATGHKFIPDESTTRAVRKRMEAMDYYLRGEVPPVKGIR